MIQDIQTDPLLFIFSLLSLIIAISVHEFSHAIVADRLGDPTPQLQGRVTLNPMAHIDLLGIAMILLVGFGWGKPVQFDPFNLRHPRKDAAFISIAGPLSNLIMALVGAGLFHLLLNTVYTSMSESIYSVAVNILLNFLVTFVLMNIRLCVFNLIPIHPLDGFKIVGGFLSREYAKQWYELERYGFIFLIIMLLPIANGASPLSGILNPVTQFFIHLLFPGFNK